MVRKFKGLGLRSVLLAGTAMGLAGCASMGAEDGGVSAAAAQADPTASELSALAAEISELEVDIPFTKYVLENGLTLVVHEDNRTPTVNVQVYYHVGSKNEPDGRSGFAHLFEHLMFNGSENFNDDFFAATQQIGATNQNGTTSTDRTNYYQTVPTEALDTVLWLESDRMGYLLGAVDQARLDEQRGVVQNEKRQGENQPYGLVYNHIVAAMYPEEHPYGHTVIGSMEDLEAATLDDVRDWFNKWYGPSNAVLVLAGNITPEEAKAKVEQYFGELPPGPPVSHPKSWIPDSPPDQREVMYDRVPQPRIYRNWHVPELGHPDGEQLDAISSALAGDRNARLTKRLVHDEEVATGVFVSNGQSEIAGRFQIVVVPKPDADLDYIEQAIDEELAKLLAEGPTAAELEKVKVGTLRGLVDSLERAPAKAQLLATWETFTGDPNGWKTSLERLQAVTSESAREAANRWLTRGSYTLTVLPFEDYKAFAEKVDRSAMPLPTSVADATFPDYHEAELSNGIRVMLAERHDVPRVDIQLMIDTGIGPDWASVNEGVASLSASLLDEGTETRTALEIADQLDRLGAGVGTGGGNESASVSMSSLTVTLDPVLEIFAEVAREPAFREADFNREKAQYVQGIRQSLSQPNAIAARVLGEKLWGEDHPYGRSVTPEEAEAITREDVAKFHADWYGANNATLIVVGDTTLEEMLPKLEAQFGDWGDAPMSAIEVERTARPAAAQVYLVDRPGSLQSVIMAGSTMPELDAQTNFRERLFNDLFGGNFTSRVNMNLREDKGWSYGSRTGISGGEGPRQFQLTAPVQTDATKGALEELRRELTEVVGSNPATPEELEKVQTNAVLGLSSRWETGAAVGASLAGIVTYDFPEDYFQTYADSLREVTLDDVRLAGREIIPDQNLVWVIVGDLSKIEADVRSVGLGDVTVVDEQGNVLR